MLDNSFHVLIIGAGTGGLALAHGLNQAGIRVSVFERDHAPHDVPGGYRVGISPAGTRALKACVPAPIFDLFGATCARPPQHFSMLTEQWSELVRLEFTGEAADPVDGEKNVDRMVLRRVLLMGLENVVAFGKTFRRYVPLRDGKVTVQFEDGTEATGDVLIGADGAGSRLRRQRLPHARHEETGILSLGGKLPMTGESKGLLTEKMFQGMSMILAPKGVGAIIHSLEFAWNRPRPPLGADGTGSEFRKRWPHFPNETTDDYISWGLWAARRNLPVDPTTLSGPDLVRLGGDMTVGWHPHMSKLVRSTDPASAVCISIRTSVPVPPWESSNVTLLGDAIHTMTPGRGAGANTALRDAALLCKALTDVRNDNKPLVQAIHDYEVEMLRYSTEAVLESRKQMNANDLIHKPVLGRIQLAAMRGGMRMVNAIPALKKRITENVLRVRGAN
jgi:2-polyprenyl-6-methoxyphenol hydroxylase-like FAD-dependent oxidoreductase